MIIFEHVKDSCGNSRSSSFPWRAGEDVGAAKRIWLPWQLETNLNAVAGRIHEFGECGENADPALDAIQHGEQRDMLNGNVMPEGANCINGVSWVRLRFFLSYEYTPERLYNRTGKA